MKNAKKTNKVKFFLFNLELEETKFKSPFIIDIRYEYVCIVCENKLKKYEQINDLSIEMKNNKSNTYGWNFRRSVNKLNFNI